jgi:hypothetical protein
MPLALAGTTPRVSPATMANIDHGKYEDAEVAEHIDVMTRRSLGLLVRIERTNVRGRGGICEEIKGFQVLLAHGVRPPQLK